jgi:hypothetical protein
MGGIIMLLKALYMFLDPSADSAKHRAIIETENSKMILVGVNSVEEGAKIARHFVEEGVVLVELCGAFGYEGAKKVHDQVGNEVPVGMIAHQVWNATKLAELLGRE